MPESNEKKSKIIVTGGGTGGHIYPALAVADELTRRGYDVIYAGCPGHMEETLAKKAGYEFVPFESSGFNRAHPISLVKGIAKNMKTSRAAARYIDENDVVVVVAFGGYACLPAGLGAKSAKRKLVVHEQNSHVGMANKYLAQCADVICLTYVDAAKELGVRESTSMMEHPYVVISGNPVRQEIIETDREECRKHFGYAPDDIVVLAFGGSLGAKTINDAMIDAKHVMLDLDDNVKVIQVAGRDKFDETCEALSLSDSEKNRWRTIPYADNMPELLACADIVVSRAGATTLAELSERCVPSVLVPFPNAADDHQAKNAISMEKSGGAIVVSDAEAQHGMLADTLAALVQDDSRRASMRYALEETCKRERRAVDVIADAVEEAAKTSKEHRA